MKMKRFSATEMRHAMQKVNDELGPDALILSSRKTEDGVEIIAAVDYEEELRGAAAMAPVKADNADTRPAAVPKPAVQQPAPTSSAPAQPVVDSQVVSGMQQEIRALRAMLEVPLAQLGWDAMRRREPVRAAVIERLELMQLHPVIANRIADRIAGIDDAETGWKQALAELEQMLPIAGDDLMEEGGVVALVGPTWVGKTTTIAKIAARFALHHGRRHVALVTMDHYRIGAHEQLRTYGKLLGVPVHIAGDEEELRVIINQMDERKLILIDTAGTSQRDTDLLDKFTMLNGGGTVVRRYLVLAANSQMSVNDEVLQAFSALRPDKCILTKMDEATSLGGVLSVLIKHGLPLVYTGDGQRVPDDFHAARACQLTAHALLLAERGATTQSDEAWLHALGNTEATTRVHAHA
ncbi:MAG TPA: flagellar biosynthesis protein FlhF [Gammaproteobacteria bacterium]|nr:flagellar biosynthesis protein FlhF [Gammaproteobacteria bacterium]